ncbi:nitrate reductase molybdenum cofactor assembly chaperone [Jiangella rhizosphaerae]|uniref:Nitrate reductase molybdenum cofactor assembly chaperone n=1 Tax=Jiangella rhizosphaerae TaxID=2293569 RepID=A0A418KLK6_9ACTN|nr:nitrate reductase molybdenum cofactor assembly chaperone [Jiangella rhizosphaerae]RIQ18821.1 nitrate reductase molybdenum cofactor assembly chaperone [Jiangella rhizosphaerae]
MIGRRRDRAADHRVVHQVASWCLDYPDATLVQRLPLLGRALAEQSPSDAVARLSALVDHLGGRPLADLQRDYVDVFDLSRDRALHLSYWTDGDTRRRGEVLARFKAAYRASGFVVDLHGELPDHLPTVLEFAAIADPAAGTALLQEYRPSLELLRFALLDLGTPYADGVAAVCATLPGESPPDRAAVHAAARPPVETVGLELQPYGDRP